jgi:hypothetical protein
MNLPVVTNKGWGDIDILVQKGMPLLIAAKPEEYKNVADRLTENKGSFGRDWIIGKFDLQTGIQKYAAIYRSLMEIRVR